MPKFLIPLGVLTVFALLGLGAWSMLDASADVLESSTGPRATTNTESPTDVSSADNAPQVPRMTAMPPQRKSFRAAPDEIIGRVFNAANELLAGARVSLTPVAPLPAQYFSGTTLRCVTNTDGEFRCKTIENAHYAVVAEAASHQPRLIKSVSSGSVVDIELLAGAVLDVKVLDLADDSPLAGVEVQITRGTELPPAKATTAADGLLHFDELVPGSFEGSLFATMHLDLLRVPVVITSTAQEVHCWRLGRGKQVRGVIRSARGAQPIRGALVAEGRKRARSDDDGRYVLQGLPAHGISIEVHADSWQTASDYVDLAGSRVFATRDFTLQPSGVIAGVVLDPAGNPVQGARVAPLQCHGDSYVYNLDDSGLRTATTGVDGRFVVSGFQPREAKTYAVRAECDGWPPLISDVFALEELNPRVDIVMRLSQSVVVIQGTVVDETDQGIGGVLVIAESSPSGAAKLLPPVCTRTNADGTYSFKDIPDGVLTMEAIASGFLRGRSVVEVVGGEISGKAPKLKLRKGQVVRGVVTDSAGAPVNQAQMQIRGSSSREQTTSAVDGSFSMLVVGAPPWSVSATAPHYEQYNEAKTFPDAENLVKITLKPATMIRVAVRERGNSRPLDSFSLKAIDADSTQSAQRKSENRSRFGRSLEPVEMVVRAGEQIILAHADGFLPSELRVDVPAGTIKDLGMMELDRGVTLDGVVHLANGSPIAEARLLARGILQGIPEDSYRELGQSGNDGWVQSSGLRPGVYDLVIETEVAPLLALNNFRLDAESGSNLDLLVTPETHLILSALRDHPPSKGARENSGNWIKELSVGSFEFNSEFFQSRPGSRLIDNSQTNVNYSITAQAGTVIGFVQGTTDPVHGRLWHAKPQLVRRGRGADLRAAFSRLPKGTYTVELKLGERVLAQHTITLKGEQIVQHQFDVRTKPPAPAPVGR